MGSPLPQARSRIFYKSRNLVSKTREIAAKLSSLSFGGGRLPKALLVEVREAAFSGIARVSWEAINWP